MVLILIITTLLFLSQALSLQEKITHYSSILHHFCLHSLPNTVENLGSLEALVCGQNMQDPETQELLVQSSLIHIFIVSGSHFLFLRKIIAGIPILRRFPLSILFFYALVTRFQAPSVRALLFLTLTQVSESKKLFLAPVILVFLSALLSVAVFPHWLYSRSLLMSTLASLVITIMSEIWRKEKDTLPALFLTQSAVYFFMGFCLWGYSNLHPLSILLNIILGPLIGTLLFPLGFFVVLVPSCAFLFDMAVEALFWILKKNMELLGSVPHSSPISLFGQWSVFFALLTFSHYILIYFKRRKARHV